MCGINGIFVYHPAAVDPDETELLRTRDYMVMRGPDGQGAWWTASRRCALGHRRLSIIDLSENAAQPMIGYDGKYVVNFNGEIYNYPALRAKLEADGVSFATTSDTEVLLHLYARHGLEMVRELRGMFAFAIWDELQGGLFLARDPYGIKPLYTANNGWTFRSLPRSRRCWPATRCRETRSRPEWLVSICSAACPNRSRSIARSARCRPAMYSGSTAPARVSRSPTLQFRRS